MAMNRTLGLVLGLALGACFLPLASARESTLTEADREAFAWFDRLGFPACAGKPFVCLTRTSEKPEDGEEPWSTCGFLLAETPESFTIIGDGVFPWTMPRRRSGSIVTKGPSDLAEIASECLAAVREQVRTGSRGGFLRGLGRLCGGPVGGLDTPAAVFVLARRCAENGLEGLASELLAETRKHIASGSMRPRSASLRECVADEIADLVHSKIVVDHGDRDVSRPELLRAYHDWLRLYPDSPLRKKVEDEMRILAAMVTEDERHTPIPDDRLAALPVSQRVQELIYRLRDQEGGQWSNPGSPSIYSLAVQFRMEEKSGTPAGQIEAIGMEAVPALIEALEDTRFTRALGFHRSWDYSSYYVVRVGDAARELLENIAGQVFWQGTTTRSSMVKDGHAKETKEKYLAWWRSRIATPSDGGK